MPQRWTEPCLLVKYLKSSTNHIKMTALCYANPCYEHPILFLQAPSPKDSNAAYFQKKKQHHIHQPYTLLNTHPSILHDNCTHSPNLKKITCFFTQTPFSLKYQQPQKQKPQTPTKIRTQNKRDLSLIIN